MSVIEARDLNRTFTVRERRGLVRRTARTVHAVSDLTFDVDAGEAVGYIGPNGAGKSTTIKMLTGILVPSSGHLRVADLDPSRSRTELARRIGVVFGQRTGLWWDLPLGDSFELLRRIYRVPQATYAHNLATFVDLLDLGDLLGQPVRQLSLGQRMRGDIVAALLHDPQILYLDEPTIGLDVLSKQRLRGFLRELNTERGTTILLTTHDLVDIEQVCRRVMVIDRGRLVFDGDFPALHQAGESTRTVVVDFAEPVAAVTVPGATVARVDGARQWLTVPAGSPTGPVVAALAQRHAIADLSIQEPSIEDVLPHLYAG
jgi:ABC-2 type transport system ATP-binding protein